MSMRKSVFWEILFLMIFISTCVYYIFRSNQNFRVFVYNKTKDARIFLKKDLPLSQYVLQEKIPQMQNFIVDSVAEAQSVYQEAGNFFSENESRSLMDGK